MAIGAITSGDQAGAKPSTPVFVDFLSFAGDGAYPSGGTLGFQASVRAALGDQREILAVIGQDCGGYVPVYLPGTDALKVYEQTNVATSPLIETATADLSGTTFNVVVISR